MLSCLILGDSLGVGLASQMPTCFAHAKVGISALGIDTTYVPIKSGLTVISLGSNQGANTKQHLEHLRQEITGRVIWLLPAALNRDTVRYVASQYGDTIIDARSAGANETHIHPSVDGYKILAQQVKEVSEKTEAVP